MVFAVILILFLAVDSPCAEAEEHCCTMKCYDIRFQLGEQAYWKPLNLGIKEDLKAFLAYGKKSQSFFVTRGGQSYPTLRLCSIEKTLEKSTVLKSIVEEAPSRYGVFVKIMEYPALMEDLPKKSPLFLCSKNFGRTVKSITLTPHGKEKVYSVARSYLIAFGDTMLQAHLINPAGPPK